MPRRRERVEKTPIIIIPAKEFLDNILKTHSFVPKRIYLDESCLVSSVFDFVFNDHLPETADIVKSCFSMTSYADQGDIEYVHELIGTNLTYYADLLKEARDKIDRLIPFYSYADLYRISWETKSIYMKAL